MPTRTLGRRTALITTLLASAVLVAAPLGAAAKDGDVIRTGSCSASTDWKLKLSPEDGRVEVEFEVDQNRNGQTWNVTLKKNGIELLERPAHHPGALRLLRDPACRLRLQMATASPASPPTHAAARSAGARRPSAPDEPPTERQEIPT